MRTIVLTRGVPGVGKSTFIEKYNLEPYTISLDDLRMKFDGLSMNVSGNFSISNVSGKRVVHTSKMLLETRMKKGTFIVYDATNMIADHLVFIKQLARKYRYRTVIVDFMQEDGLTVDKVIQRNAKRASHKQVPEHVIHNFWKIHEEEELPKWATVITPEQFQEKVFTNVKTDLSTYKKVIHIGDIHSCASVLKEYLNGRLNEEYFYIFTGDYLERGIETVETIQLLMKLQQNDNVVMLKGNHEAHLWKFATDEPTKSREFNKVTQFELAKVSKKDIRNFWRKLRTYFHYTYNEKEVIVTHGGLPKLPEKTILMTEHDIVHGVGDYSTDIDTIFNNLLTDENVYQVHGHRNNFNLPVIYGSSINLEGQVEYGGSLRVAELTSTGWQGVQVKNTVFKPLEARIDEDTTLESAITMMKENPHIREKGITDRIKSFNFTRNAFNEGIWDTMTTRARGLHIDTVSNEIVARGFDKFFNISDYTVPEVGLNVNEKKEGLIEHE